MRRGVAPSHIPTAGTTFPLDTLLFNASLFSFSRGVILFSTSGATRHLPLRGRLLCTSAREFTVVPRPICGWRYTELYAFIKF